MKRESNGSLMGAILVCIALAGVYFTVQPAISQPAMYPANGCSVIDGKGFNVKWLGYQSAGQSDDNCNLLESARLDPNKARSVYMRCSTPASIKAFGGGTDAIMACTTYNGDVQSAIARVQDQLTICRKRSKKLRYRLSFKVRRKFTRCMSAL